MISEIGPDACILTVVLEPDPVLECFGLVVEAIVRRDNLVKLFGSKYLLIDRPVSFR